MGKQTYILSQCSELLHVWVCGHDSVARFMLPALLKVTKVKLYQSRRFFVLTRWKPAEAFLLLPNNLNQHGSQCVRLDRERIQHQAI